MFLFDLMFVVVVLLHSILTRERNLWRETVGKNIGPSGFNEKHPLHIIDTRNSHFCLFRAQIIEGANLAAKIIPKAVIFCLF
jgi:hypothetical protein